jgi:energy-coupling factor transporter ATP-binding protein EcfA2/energy-coupling factor transporter transmembrane protein EcfT
MAENSRTVVEVTDLTWTPFASAQPLLRKVSFTLTQGERALLVGPSGSGKSTLLRAIAGVLSDSEAGEQTGQVFADQAGLLLQDPNDSLVSETIYREVAFGLENSGVSREIMPVLVEQSLGSVGLNKTLDHPSNDLSGGEMQRMAFAGVIAATPNLLLLDEPTSMLDSEAAASVRAAVRARLDATGATMLLVEHRFDNWLNLVNRILVLNAHGELIFDGEPEAVIRDHAEQLQDLGIWLPGLPAPRPDQLDLGHKPGGALTVLTGKSGAGKTTELKRRLRSDPAARAGALLAGYVPQQAELTILGNTVFESVGFTARRAKVKKADVDARINSVLHALRVLSLADRNPYEISGGEQRRVALASALAHQPASLYLDEPTVGQDRDSWSAIIGAISAARAAGMRVTIATHDADLIAMADELVAIEPMTEVAPKTSTPNLSGLAIFLAPLILLAGSTAITTVAKGLIALGSLACAALVMGALGFRLKRWRAFLPGLIGVASIGLSNWYLSPQENLQTGLVAALRVATFVLPGIAVAVEIQPIPFGDQLGQIIRLPGRPVVAAVGAMQRMSSQLALWDELRFIHQIRGVTVSRLPVSRLKQFGQLVFAQLVQAIRSAGTTAVAMDARGFSKSPVSGVRTWAKPAKFARLDGWAIGLSIAIAVVLLVSN